MFRAGKPLQFELRQDGHKIPQAAPHAVAVQIQCALYLKLPCCALRVTVFWQAPYFGLPVRRVGRRPRRLLRRRPHSWRRPRRTISCAAATSLWSFLSSLLASFRTYKTLLRFFLGCCLRIVLMLPYACYRDLLPGFCQCSSPPWGERVHNTCRCTGFLLAHVCSALGVKSPNLHKPSQLGEALRKGQ